MQVYLSLHPNFADYAKMIMNSSIQSIDLSVGNMVLVNFDSGVGGEAIVKNESSFNTSVL